MHEAKTELTRNQEMSHPSIKDCTQIASLLSDNLSDISSLLFYLFMECDLCLTTCAVSPVSCVFIDGALTVALIEIAPRAINKVVWCHIVTQMNAG